jgi:hypothetical protein
MWQGSGEKDFLDVRFELLWQRGGGLYKVRRLWGRQEPVLLRLGASRPVGRMKNPLAPPLTKGEEGGFLFPMLYFHT